MDTAELKRVKIRELTKQATNLLCTARWANANQDHLQWQVKVLEAFILIDLAWKIGHGQDSEADEKRALVDFESLQAAMYRRASVLVTDVGNATKPPPSA